MHYLGTFDLVGARGSGLHVSSARKALTQAFVLSMSVNSCLPMGRKLGGSNTG